MLLDLLYPRRCPLCQNILTERGVYICGTCRKKAVPIKEPRCQKCGKALQKTEKEFCSDCRSYEHSYDRGFAVFPYVNEIRDSMSRFKFHNKREYADFYCHEAEKLYGSQIQAFSPDCIIPIPMYKRKKNKRGYNQAEVLAKNLGKRLHIPVETKILARIRNTTPQKELTRKDRENNLKKAFKIRKNDVVLKKVLLMDDIYTTGATIDAVAALLKENGTEEICFLAICIGKG